MTERTNSQQIDEPHGCIELIRCVPATDEERKAPRYIPKLEINEQAQAIISERFESPISIIAYVGKVGVGKSKLASLTVETLRRTPSNPPLRPFRSGGAGTPVTHGVWMWSEPLRHLDEDQQGSILVLDCEGMGELDEDTGDNLYLFCMIMSTVFAVVLRAVRVDRYLYDQLYHALRRFKSMHTPYLLPNLCLVAMDMPSFIRSDPVMGDVPIPKDQWLKEIFSNTSSTLSHHDNESIQLRYDYITGLLPQIDAVNIDYLPRKLVNNNEKLDIHTILREESSKEFYTSLQIAIKKLLSNGGKRLPGSQQSSLFVRPAELTAIMSDLIDVLNENKMPNADILISRYLLTRFMNEIVEQQVAEFQEKLLAYAHNTLGDAMSKRQKPETPNEISATDNQMKDERDRLTTQYIGAIIRLARYQIYGLDTILSSEYVDVNEQEKALFELPKSVQEKIKDIKTQMNGYQEPELFIKKMHANLVIEDLHRQQQEQRKLLQETMKKLENKRDLVHREQRINDSLKLAKPVRIGLAPCAHCGRPGGAINYVHWKKHCPSRRTGNYYYYHREDERMVCDACRQVDKIDDQRVECSRCGRTRKVTRFFKFNE
ncbi:unnamed protein product [Rotaria sp. Silwood1]|nr:unnamed protein product [Rotaria sp. Silwood1]CAF1643729.1 unnamed protein product [Rotaria sp. Silwood1]